MKLLQRFAQGMSLLACTGAALAHEGHGMGAVHWHASDLAGLGFVAVLAGFVIWSARGE